MTYLKSLLYSLMIASWVAGVLFIADFYRVYGKPQSHERPQKNEEWPPPISKGEYEPMQAEASTPRKRKRRIKAQSQIAYANEVAQELDLFDDEPPIMQMINKTERPVDIKEAETQPEDFIEDAKQPVEMKEPEKVIRDEKKSSIAVEPEDESDRGRTVQDFEVVPPIFPFQIARNFGFSYPVRTYLAGTTGRGLGYEHGYGTAGIFVTSDCGISFYPFTDLRWHLFGSNKYAGNFGIGARFQPLCYPWLIGANLFYDIRKTEKRFYRQVSGGIEAFGPCFDFRLNVYVPQTKKGNDTPDVCNYPGGYEVRFKDCEFATKLYEAEIGTCLGSFCGFSAYAAGGAYWIANDIDRRSLGGKARLNAYYKDYITVELGATFDHIYHERFHARFVLSFPFAIGAPLKRRCFTRNPCFTNAPLTTPVVHNEIIILDEHTCWKTNYDLCDY